MLRLLESNLREVNKTDTEKTNIKMKKKLFFFLQHISKDMHSLPSSFIAEVIPVGDQLILDP